MNLTNFEKLQDTLAIFAFTNHFHMETFCSILSPTGFPSRFEILALKNAGKDTPCGTTLCLAGFGTAHYLSEQHDNFAPTPEHLASDELHDSLVEERLKHHFNSSYYTDMSEIWLDISRYQGKKIWFYPEWPKSIGFMYRNPQVNNNYLAIISDPNRISKLSQYQLPLSYFRALAGAIALQAFVEFSEEDDDVDIESWVDRAEALEEICNPSNPIAFWIQKYSDLVMRFETIALNSEAAKQFILN